MKISRNIVLASLVTFGLVHADVATNVATSTADAAVTNSSVIKNLLNRLHPVTVVQAVSSRLASAADKTAATLYIAALTEKVSSYFNPEGTVGAFLKAHSTEVNRSFVALLTAAALYNAYKLVKSSGEAEETDETDEYSNDYLFDNEDDFAETTRR
jgi:hypothetical protein